MRACDSGIIHELPVTAVMDRTDMDMRFMSDSEPESTAQSPRMHWAVIGAVAFGLFTDFLLLTMLVPILATLLHADSTARLSVTAVGLLLSAKAGAQVCLAWLRGCCWTWPGGVRDHTVVCRRFSTPRSPE